MAEENKTQLTEEEIVARKVKMRRTISYILMILASISIIVFIFMAFMTKGNIDTQTEINTQELRSKLKNIIALENRYFKENGEYAEIKFLGRSKQIERYNPMIDGFFRYEFDPETKLATGMEKDASNDVNGDADGRDGLTLSIDWVPGEVDDTEFFWTESDKDDFLKRREIMGLSNE